MASQSVYGIELLRLVDIHLSGVAWNIELPPCLDDFKPFVKSGCFQDNGGALIYRSGQSQANMTVENLHLPSTRIPAKPLTYGIGNGFRYAGLKYYGVCFCGPTVNGPQVDDAQCKLPCNGDKGEICGGDKTLSVWQDPTFPKGPDDTTVDDYKSVGCYTDGASTGRTLSWPAKVDAATFTTKACLAACEKQGFPYAGTEFGKECWCGSVLANNTAKVDSSECNIPCSGDASDKCGGSKRLSLYVAKDLESLEPCGYKPPTTTTTATTSGPAGTTTTGPGESTTTKPGESTTTTRPGESTTSTGPGESTTTKPGESTTTTRPGESTTTKPGESTTTKPGESTTTKPGESTTTKPGESTTTKPGESTTTKPGESTTTNPGESTTTKPGESTTTNPGESTTTKPSESTTTKPGETTTTKPGESTTTTGPGESTTTKPGESTTTTRPGESTTSTGPGESTTTKPGESTTTTRPGESTTTKPGESTTTKPGESTTTKPGESTTTPGPTTTKPTTTTPGSPTTTTVSLCTATTTTPPTCEWKIGDWCAPGLPDWNDKVGCLLAAKTCELQGVSCFAKAGLSHVIDCFKFTKWCASIKVYCVGCILSKTCNKGDCWNKNRPQPGTPPVTSTSVYPCPPSTTLKPTTTTKPPVTTSCAPEPTNICTQPTNDKWGYGPGKPVGGIPLPAVCCNDIKDDWKKNPFKLYSDPDSKKCPSFTWPSRPNVCQDACKAQYDSCRSTYVEGCKTLWRKRTIGGRSSEAEAETTTAAVEFERRWLLSWASGDKTSCSSTGALWSWGGSGSDAPSCWGKGGNTPDKAGTRCKAQYDDCVAANKNVNPGDKCSTWCKSTY
ncbi:putative glyoxal oxidase precursor [Purpureocillium lavendulum]|uniref:Glyoxal oxidase n=1 Tax=Purpureocillium lavendulum TaxID=1247861 RepID=A0AB34G5M2_9HYPO|nr:putative glyoxal oxidase precursor [Purpureocillium lavendulum]